MSTFQRWRSMIHKSREFGRNDTPSGFTRITNSPATSTTALPSVTLQIGRSMFQLVTDQREQATGTLQRTVWENPRPLSANSYRARISVQQRAFLTGCNDDRFMFVIVSIGRIQKNQRCREAPRRNEP